MAIILKSTEFEFGGSIPEKYTADGENISPPLAWTGQPDDAISYVIICEDPDAPGNEPFVHWLIYDIPARVTSIPEGLSPDSRFVAPFPAKQGKNSFGHTGYRGPKPPVWHGPHRYLFKIRVLDSELELGPGATKQELLDAMAGKVLESGELLGLYKRGFKKLFRAA